MAEGTGTRYSQLAESLAASLTTIQAAIGGAKKEFEIISKILWSI